MLKNVAEQLAEDNVADKIRTVIDNINVTKNI